MARPGIGLYGGGPFGKPHPDLRPVATFEAPILQVRAIAAIILITVGGVLTKAGHFPINASMMTWDPAAPPPEWMAVKAKWEALHLVRTAATILAFALLIVVNLLRSGSAR